MSHESVDYLRSSGVGKTRHFWATVLLTSPTESRGTVRLREPIVQRLEFVATTSRCFMSKR